MSSRYQILTVEQNTDDSILNVKKYKLTTVKKKSQNK
jgi:hypothetical protein